MPLTDPVPSSAFDVLERNIQDTDKFVNQESGTFTNRVGKVIKPIPVIQDEANAAVISLGWHQVGLFADGFTYTLQNDIAKDSFGDWYRWNGVLPKVVTAGTLPSSDANFVKIDYKSHSDLTGRNPANGSAHNANDVANNNGGTVQDFIDNLESPDSNIIVGGIEAGKLARESGYQSAKTLMPYVFDLHFGALKGCGQRDGEAIGQRSYTLSAGTTKGAFTVALSSVSGIVVGSGVVFLASNGEYYTNTVAGISGNTLTLKQPLEADILAGQNCWNLWNDEAHVTIQGYYAVADYLLRSTLQPSKEILKTSDFRPLVSATVESVLGVNDVDFPGSFASETIRLTTNGTANQGARVTLPNLPIGEYEIPFQINTGGATVLVSITEVSTGYTLFADTNVTKSDASTLLIKFRLFKQGDVRFNIGCNQAAQVNFSQLRLLRVGDGRIDFKGAKLALFGDSWFAAGHIPARLQERLPATTILNLGIGGNSAQSLIDRFDSDVAPEKPDIVWVNTSTNDYFQGGDANIYMWRMTQVLQKVRSIGASCIVSTPTVGNVDTAPHRFDRSRIFYNNQTIFEQMDFIPQSGTFHVSSHDQQIAGPAGNILSFAFLGFFRGKIIIKSHYFNNLVGVFAGANINSITLVAQLSKGYNGGGVTLDLGGDKFVVMKAINESGNSEVIRGYMFVDKSTCDDAS